MKNYLRSLLIAVTVLLVAAGCGGSDAPTEQAAPTVAATAESTQTPAEAEPVVAIDGDSPVEAMLGVPVFDEDAMNKWFAELDVERRRITATCMIAKGFEYSTEAPNQASQFTTELATASREYAVTHGYGIIASFNAAEYDPSKSYGTTNSQYLASLTETETDAYNVALFGGSSDEDFVDNESTFGVEGCLGDGLEEVFEIVGVLDSLGPVADGYYDQILADSRSIALYDTWSTCMAQAGFSFALPDDARESFYERLDAVTNNPGSFEQTEIPDEAQQGALIDFSGDSYSTHPRLTEQAQVELDALQADELATAVASWDCYEPLRDEEIAIQREYEAKFVEEVGPQLAADQAAN